MATGACAVCGRDRSGVTGACPHCGAPPPVPSSPPDFGNVVFSQRPHKNSIPRTGGRRWAVPAGISVVAGALVIAMIVGLIQVGAKIGRERKADEAALRDIQAAFDARKASLNGQPAADAPVTTLPATEGTLLQRAAAIMTKFQRQASAADIAYLQSLADLQLEHVLSPPRLTSREGIERNRVVLAQALASLRDYDAANNARLAAFEAEIMGLKDARGFPEFMRGFESQREKTYQHNTRALINQQQTFAAAMEVTEFMAGRIHSTHVEGDAIMFQTDADVAEYNRLIKKVHALAAEEERIRAETLATLDRQAEKARTLKTGP